MRIYYNIKAIKHPVTQSKNPHRKLHTGHLFDYIYEVVYKIKQIKGVIL